MIKPDLIEFKNKYLDVNISQGLQNNGRKNENKSSILESIQWILNDHPSSPCFGTKKNLIMINLVSYLLKFSILSSPIKIIMILISPSY